MNKIEYIYFRKICSYNKDKHFELMKYELEYILKTNTILKINIILYCESIEILEYFSYLIYLLMRSGINKVLYSLELINNSKISINYIYLKKIKEISNNDKNNSKIYLCINSLLKKEVNGSFSKINYINDWVQQLDMHLNYINEIKDILNKNKASIASITNVNNIEPNIFYITKKYIDGELHYDELLYNKDIYKLDSKFVFSKHYYYYFNKYNITYYDNNSEATKLNYNYKQFIKTGLDFKSIPNIDNVDSFILVIDFPKLGGGTTYFLSTIIEKYKYNQTFVTIRNDNNMLNISINDEYMFEQNYSFDEYIIFIKNNINKISKIFVNHMMSHTDNFIQHLFTLGKEVTYITHDYYALYNRPQPTYDIIANDVDIRNDTYINKFDQIITQNINNLFIFDKFLNDKKNIIVTELPDYKYSQDLYETQNEKIIIGVVGGISDIKGSEFFKSFDKYIKENNLDIEIVVFGVLNESFITQNIYSTINDFNNLLIKYKPNLFVEASIWPETYSYSLTLMMKTQLPILSIKKSFELVIHDRLKKYDKFYQFENTTDCVSTTYKYKQNYFYTINPTLYFNSFWDSYFIPKKEKLTKYKNNINIVLITSKIIVSDVPFSYSNTRSNYSTDVRFEQTLETIDSIKKNIPNCFIVLFDNSIFDNNLKYKLENCVDKFINIPDDDMLNYYTNKCEFKAFGDIYQQIKFFDTFLNLIDLSNVSNLFKISGRYLINEFFNYSTYDNNYSIMKKNELVLDRDYFFTSFYKISNLNITNYFNELKNVIKNKEKFEKQDCEVIVGKIMKDSDNLQITNTLGLTQRIAIFNEGIKLHNKNNI
jgi:hypothetical protein